MTLGTMVTQKEKFKMASMGHCSSSERTPPSFISATDTTFSSPPSSQPSPFGLIANSTKASINEMQEAEKKAQFAMLSDWDHLTSSEYRAVELASGLDLFCVDSLLVNGKGSVNCQSQALLNALTPPPLLALLNGATVSDRGYVLPSF